MSATASAPPIPRVGLSGQLDSRGSSGLLHADGTSTHDDCMSVSIGNEASADGNLSATTRQFTPGAVRVLLSKLALMGLLLITASIIAFSVYVNESSNEEANFKTQVRSAHKENRQESTLTFYLTLILRKLAHCQRPV
jgi:hypothetical protein